MQTYVVEFSSKSAWGAETRFTLDVRAACEDEALEIVHWAYHEIVGEHGLGIDCNGNRFCYKVIEC